MRVLFLIALVLCLTEATRSNRNKQKTLRKVLRTYDKDEPPPGGPTQVRIGVSVNQLRMTDESTMNLVMYLRQAWRDSRLAGLGQETKLGGYRHELIWRPDLFFRNSRRAQRRTNGMTVEQLTKINNTGHVFHVTTIEGDFYCPTTNPELRDIMCNILFESYGNTMDTLYFRWLDSPIGVDPSVRIPGYTFADRTIHDCSQNYTAGAFPCLETRFILRRDNFVPLPVPVNVTTEEQGD